ncbi:Ccw12p NDAI_0G02720 [Naumovozyma dairenensis CBS 421]|uniref:Uncharacterized protein n=1 Tax=Naumovozyma dairenensis (strain ATCC 10597 / BCRC 20456 / CBS 421 / NBRC 0211 / NRRL Y-12639) TaxID=1071378 RepID=G0WE38_NAUDC|nr:hypothetical protein NDAI_0G02720 [Naumovozyma dairenensis CBS 421]CCD26049.2 hypothetical protein NDAI_0G02720 [Naumovozyma dairenensis CBS 421]
MSPLPPPTRTSTTYVTITDCEEHVCKETVSPALVSTATVTVNNQVTEYTTYCPISTEHHNSTTKASPTSTKAQTKNATSSHTIHSSYTGAAVKALPAAGALMAGVAALLL